MKLTAQTDYALRMLMLLAVKDGKQTIDDIANAYGISKNHLMKVTQRLSAAGFINTQRGKGGGLTLASQPKEINIGLVVRSIEETGKFIECQMGAANQCIVTPVCGLTHIMAGAVDSFLGHLDHYTLADVIKNRIGFEKILDS